MYACKRCMSVRCTPVRLTPVRYTPERCMSVRCQNHDIMAVVAGVGWHVTRLGEAGIAPYL
jgi:hypothetical protein